MASCASSFSRRTVKRTVKMTTFNPDTIKVGVENEKVVILFQRSDVLKLFEKEQRKDPYWELKDEIDRLKVLTKDSIVQDPVHQKTNTGWDYELAYHKLLKKGKAQIKDKRSGLPVDRIIYEKYVMKSGTEDAYFLFKNGVEFYKIMLAIGE